MICRPFNIGPIWFDALEGPATLRAFSQHILVGKVRAVESILGSVLSDILNNGRSVSPQATIVCQEETTVTVTAEAKTEKPGTLSRRSPVIEGTPLSLVTDSCGLTSLPIAKC